MSKLPAYIKMYNTIKAEIQKEIYQVGDLLPVEAELEKLFSVSRTTVRRAMELLSREGFVEIKQGRGTMVLDYRTKQNLNQVTSVSETLRRKGYTVKTKSMYIDIIHAPSNLAEELMINQGEMIARVQRIQLADEKPVAIMKNYIPYPLVQGIEEYTNQFTALYQFLEEKYEIQIDAAKDKIYAKGADFTEAEMLRVKPETALLCIRRVCFQDERPVCVDVVSIIGNQYELELSMMGRYK
ncbi:GntR family transcriptional regulator [Anaerosacchariphilus polymeriproducens]|uniref:GntR family transcriptional regulator n=1 Tax=Anaerosacchariphilus polymeriproducens TaxID=1812858 RepID=A0A371AYS3_9FIRM|nr:GntR family transcriptional regulator [Anaerosacchariphilus polymeriproducens]RDU24699.1 GntR family transcriptional regulator [Anaerosacchariphilus polymeriproducens]